MRILKDGIKLFKNNFKTLAKRTQEKLTPSYTSPIQSLKQQQESNLKNKFGFKK